MIPANHVLPRPNDSRIGRDASSPRRRSRAAQAGNGGARLLQFFGKRLSLSTRPQRSDLPASAARLYRASYGDGLASVAVKFGAGRYRVKRGISWQDVIKSDLAKSSLQGLIIGEMSIG